MTHPPSDPAGPLAPLLADIDALRTRAEALESTNATLYEQHQSLGREWVSERDRASAAEARADELNGLLVTQEICADRLAAELAEARAEVARLRDQLQGSVGKPKGWVLLPLEPTPAMLQAIWVFGPYSRTLLKESYRDLLVVAPALASEALYQPSARDTRIEESGR